MPVSLTVADKLYDNRELQADRTHMAISYKIVRQHEEIRISA
jgi:hypothetical protein